MPTEFIAHDVVSTTSTRDQMTILWHTFALATLSPQFLGTSTLLPIPTWTYLSLPFSTVRVRPDINFRSSTSYSTWVFYKANSKNITFYNFIPYTPTPQPTFIKPSHTYVPLPTCFHLPIIHTLYLLLLPFPTKFLCPSFLPHLVSLITFLRFHYLQLLPLLSFRSRLHLHPSPPPGSICLCFLSICLASCSLPIPYLLPHLIPSSG